MNQTGIFYFKYSKGMVVLAPLVITMLSYFGWVIISQGHLYAGIVWLLSVLVLFIVPILMMIDQTSDRILDEYGLSKRFKNTVWQTIAWTNIKVIRTFKLRTSNNKMRTAVHVYPLVRPKGFFLKKRIVFSPNDTDAGHLLAILSYYVAENRIAIEQKMGANWVPIKHFGIDDIVSQK